MFWTEEAQPGLSVWAWTEYNQTTTFVAATVVTIVNTLRNITSHSTIFNTVPPELRNAKTNAAGTRIETVTYTIAQVNKPTTVTSTVLFAQPSPLTHIKQANPSPSAYPSFFLKWPDY
jgi:hypothetical protein